MRYGNDDKDLVLLTRPTTSFSESNWVMQATGPKISSCFCQNFADADADDGGGDSVGDGDADADEPACILSCLADQRSELAG